MMNPQRPQIVIDSDAQLRISHNELLAQSFQSHQPASGKAPLPHCPLIQQKLPSPATPSVGFLFDWQRPCYFRLDCLTTPLLLV